MEVDFEHRSPKADDVIQVGMVDLHDEDRWIELGTSQAWNWQQGCMLQWLPGSKSEVLWNDRDGDRFVCRILDVQTQAEAHDPRADLRRSAPTARWAVARDFRRLNDTRPGYGYAGIPDPNRDVLAPDDAGIWKVDLATGKQTLLIFARRHRAVSAGPADDWKGAKHWFNHLLFSPTASRFIFLHRWRGRRRSRASRTRMLTAAADGKDLHVLDPYGEPSHFIWRDPEHVLAWAHRHQRRRAVLPVHGPAPTRSKSSARDVMTENGHCTYLPGNEWILNDTYPDKERLQHPYLYHVEDRQRGCRWAISARRRSTPASGAATRIRASAPTAGRS